MSDVDTSAEAVERLAWLEDYQGWRGALEPTAATLRALLAERDALHIDVAAKEAAAQSALEDAWAERDAALAEAARLREALRDIAADCKADYPPSHSAIKYVCHLALKEC